MNKLNKALKTQQTNSKISDTETLKHIVLINFL